MNEDRVEPGQGFPTHPHRDMEIVTYVLSGRWNTKTAWGTARCSARASFSGCPPAREFCTVNSIRPKPSRCICTRSGSFRNRRGCRRAMSKRPSHSRKCRASCGVVASPDGRDGSLTIHQDVTVFLSTLAEGQSVTHPLTPGRHAWLQVLSGAVDLGGKALAAGDGVAVSEEPAVGIQATQPAEVMLFDLN